MKPVTAYVAVVAAAIAIAVSAAGVVRHHLAPGPAFVGIAGPLGCLFLASALGFTTLRSRTYYALIYASIALFGCVLLDRLIRLIVP